MYVYVARKSKKDVLALLKERGYPSDPVKSWKAMVSKGDPETDQDTSDEAEDKDDKAMEYDYLLGMTDWYRTVEKEKELLKLRDTKVYYGVNKVISAPATIP